MVVPKLLDVNETASEMLVTVRCVIAASTDGEVDFTVPAIAERTGLTIEQVRSVLSSPTYQELLEQEVRQLVSHTLVRGVRILDSIVTSTVAKNADRIAAHRAIVQTYDVFRGQQEAPPASPEAEFNKMLASLKQGKLTVEATNASAGRTPTGPAPIQEGGERERDPSA